MRSSMISDRYQGKPTATRPYHVTAAMAADIGMVRIHAHTI
jgi:hypothetical protein